MISRRGLLGAGALLPAATALGGCAGTSGRTLRIAAGDEGGIYVTFARLLAARLEERLEGLEVEVLVTSGTVDNYARLVRGEVDLGLGLADGIAAVRERGDGVRALARTYENYLQLVVVDDGPVREVGDLAGRTVSLGAPRSGAALTGDVLLRAAGLPTSGPDRVRVQRAGLAPSLSRLRRGTTDAVLWSGGIPTPAIAELDDRLPVRMLDLGGVVPEMAALGGYPYAARDVPRVRYAPPGADPTTVGVPNILLARPGLDRETAQVVVEVMDRDAALLLPDFVRGLQYLTPALMIQTTPVELHPGAVAAYRRLHG